MIMYRDFEGNKYESYEAYCNSLELDYDIIASLLWRGKRTPQNESEERLKEELEQMKREGKYPDFDFN